MAETSGGMAGMDLGQLTPVLRQNVGRPGSPSDSATFKSWRPVRLDRASGMYQCYIAEDAGVLGQTELLRSTGTGIEILPIHSRANTRAFLTVRISLPTSANGTSSRRSYVALHHAVPS